MCVFACLLFFAFHFLCSSCVRLFVGVWCYGVDGVIVCVFVVACCCLGGLKKT